MNDRTKAEVKALITTVMNRLIHKRTVLEPFSEDEIAIKNPFGFLLAPTEVWKGAKMERSIVTSLGQGIFEQLGKIIAIGSGAEAWNQHITTVRLNTFQVDTIDSVIRRQRNNRSRDIVSPDLASELEQLYSLDSDRYLEVPVRSDLYIQRSDGREEYYSFKTVKPNLDQTEVAKRNLLSLRVGKPSCEAFFALPYNPAGDGNPYEKAGHGMPKKLLDMNDEGFVLIGAALWNKIGNDPNTYLEILDIFREVGEVASERIRKEYFQL